MKILLLSTYDLRGGAAIACFRLTEALQRREDVEVRMLVKEKSGDCPNVRCASETSFQRISAFFSFAFEVTAFSFYQKSKKERFAFVPGWFGNNHILKHPWVKEADIIHLHWIHHAYLSLRSISKLQDLGKPVVWTPHDMWALTGGCHHSGLCEGYVNNCGNCPFLKSPGLNDLSNKILTRKLRSYKNLHFIALSNWMAGLMARSRLAKDFPVTLIPNPIDTNVFKPADKNKIRSKLHLDPEAILILFAAEKISNEKKGLSYLIKALLSLKEKYSDMAKQMELLVFGAKPDHNLTSELPFKTNYLGVLKEPELIAEVYNAASIYVTPSLQENLPNTIAESLACGTPVVAFKVGGIPDLVEHQANGYLSEYQSYEDLSEGIFWVISDKERYRQLSDNARKKILSNFSYESVAERHVSLYKQLLNEGVPAFSTRLFSFPL